MSKHSIIIAAACLAAACARFEQPKAPVAKAASLAASGSKVVEGDVASSNLTNSSSDLSRSMPTCEFGSASDPDGDGWGWENNHSCRVVPLPPGTPATPPAASTPKAPDGEACTDAYGPSASPADLVAGHCIDRASSYYTAGGKIYRGKQEIRLKGINWFGFEGTYLGLHGLWTGRSLESFVDQMQGLGLNALRIPLSPEALDGWRRGQDGYSSPLAQLNRVIQYAGQKGMYILLDLHTCSMNNNAQMKPGPATGACSFYSEGQWTANLKTLAGIAAANGNVIGIDLFNEPFGLTYAAWKGMAERAAHEVLMVNPRVLIFMEGVGNASTPGNFMSFWGENLYEAPHNVPEIVSSRLVFSPHVYGPSVSEADYFTASNFPDNMAAVWDSHFGTLARDGHPLVIGEFGGAYTGRDKTWQDAFVSYMLKAAVTSSFYWSLNPDSGDTKGLLLDDWRSVDQAKLRLLQRLQ